MPPQLFLAALLATLATATPTPSTPISYSLPKCDAAHTSPNNTIMHSLQNLLGEQGQQGAQLGMYSIHIGSYAGFGDMLPATLSALNEATSNVAQNLKGAEVKCGVCQVEGEVRNDHPAAKGVVSFSDLGQIFDQGTNIVTNSLLYKYCQSPDTGVCQEYPPYCSDAPAGGEAPEESSKEAVWEFVAANLAAFGTGPASSRAGLPGSTPKGTIFPYYKCLKQYAKPAAVAKFEDSWFAFARALMQLWESGCGSGS